MRFLIGNFWNLLSRLYSNFIDFFFCFKWNYIKVSILLSKLHENVFIENNSCLKSIFSLYLNDLTIINIKLNTLHISRYINKYIYIRNRSKMENNFEFIASLLKLSWDCKNYKNEGIYIVFLYFLGNYLQFVLKGQIG